MTRLWPSIQTAFSLMPFHRFGGFATKFSLLDVVSSTLLIFAVEFHCNRQLQLPPHYTNAVELNHTVNKYLSVFVESTGCDVQLALRGFLILSEAVIAAAAAVSASSSSSVAAAAAAVAATAAAGAAFATFSA